jgi:RimJ/RimL family protein N-acetyltransferase
LKGNKCSPPDYRQVINIADGREVIVRPLRFEDRDAFLAMFNRLTRETKFLRYHYLKLNMTFEEANKYCVLDYHDTYVLVAEVDRGTGKEIIGLGRYDRITPCTLAEISFLVEDKEQGKGICTSLLKYLTDVAREKGITRFIGELTTENQIMLDILRKYKPDLKEVLDGVDIIITFDI